MKKTGCLVYIGDYNTQFCGVLVNRYKDPYEPTRIQWKVGRFCSWLISRFVFQKMRCGRRDLPQRVVSKKDGKTGTMCTWMSCWNLGSIVRVKGLISPTYKWDGILRVSYNPLIRSPLISGTLQPDIHVTWLLFKNPSGNLTSLAGKIHRLNSGPFSIARLLRGSGYLGCVDSNQGFFSPFSWVKNVPKS